MDSGTHQLLGELICTRCNIESEYVQWSLMPDKDLQTGIHRYTYHRFSELAAMTRLFRTDNTIPVSVEFVPGEDACAIAALVASHLYLDMFAGPVWCWGSLFPAFNTPPEIVREYKNKNYYLVSNLSQEAVYELHEGVQSVFENELPQRMQAAEFVAYAVQELAHASFAGNYMRKRVLKPLARYMSCELPSPFKSYMTNAFYRYLNEFFKQH